MKQIPGYEGYYLDELGNAYSFWQNKGMHGLVLKDKPRMLKGCMNKSGHISLHLGRGNMKYLHRLMIETFVGPIPKGMMVCHKNDKKNDNRLENLYVGTQKENMRDCEVNGIRPKGEKAGSSKLKDAEVLQILSMKDKAPTRELADQHNVSPRTIRRIITGSTWKHIQKQLEA